MLCDGERALKLLFCPLDIQVDIDRRYCFELVTPNSNIILQSLDEKVVLLAQILAARCSNDFSRYNFRLAVMGLHFMHILVVFLSHARPHLTTFAV